MQTSSRRSPWLFILGGCLFIIAGFVAIVVGVYYWGSSKLVAIVEEQQDPEARDRKAMEILGASVLPDGYRGGVSISLGLAKSARLTDREDGVGFDGRGFLYNESIETPPVAIIDYLDGRSGNLLDEMGTRIRTDEVVRNGTVTVDGRTVRYSLRRGEVSETDDAVPALMTIVLFECGDDRVRWGVWFQREEATTPTAGVLLEGSVGDESRLVEFLAHLEVCR